MWLLAYWWQALILMLLYSFLFLVYKEMNREHFKEPAAVLMVTQKLLGTEVNIFSAGQALLIYPQEPLEIEDEKIYVHNEYIVLERKGEIKKISAGETFDFAGGTLELVRWNNARQLINKYRTGTKSQ
ncbi:MAG: hypothetical protein VR72_12705 [Clostridiaceae bacterium BRH_c20a]|nr:MAG: hypothetical protein VR72_12705 [Clostridiaceae bacterium BRH_c20a]